MLETVAAHLDIGLLVATVVLLLSGFPVAFTLAGTAVIFLCLSLAFGGDLTLLGALPSRIYGQAMTRETLLAVPLFIYMGLMLERSRLAEDLLEAMARTCSGLPAGLGLSVIVVGAILAASTGIVGATVATMGLISLPALLRHGYPAPLAGGTVAAAGTLGQIIPPSIVLVILGDQLTGAYQQAQHSLQQQAWADGNAEFLPGSVSVGDLFAGALLPGLLLVLLYMLYLAVRGPCKVGGKAFDMPDGVQRGGFVFFAPAILVVCVLGAILTGRAAPSEAAAIGAVGALMLAGVRCGADGRLVGTGIAGFVMAMFARDLATGAPALGLAIAGTAVGVIALLAALKASHAAGVLSAVNRKTLEITAMIFAILIGATTFSLVFRGLGGDETVHAMMAATGLGSEEMLLVVMAALFLLGFVMDFVEITFVVVPIVAPVLLLDPSVSPVWLGVMIALNLQTSFLTPPFGFALFYLRGVAPDALTTWALYRGVAPFVGLQLLALALLWWFPELATWLPSVLFQG